MQNKNYGVDLKIKCEFELRNSARNIAHEAGDVAWVCEHTKTTQKFDFSVYKEIELHDSNLDIFKERNIFS